MALPSLRRRPTPADVAAAAAKKAPPAVDVPGKALVPRNQVGAAAAMTLEGVGWKDVKFGSSAWQIEGWRHYDRCGELRAVANAVAAMASQCELFIAEKVEGEPGPKAKDAKIAALSTQIY